MKKSLILCLFCLIVSLASSFGQGVIVLDNDNSGGPDVRYGAPGIPGDGVSGASGSVGFGLGFGWTAGLYYAPGDITGSIGSDGTLNSSGLPSDQNALLVLGTGPGSTALFFLSSFGLPGEFTAGSPFSTSVPAGGTITVEMIAYSGASYATALYRGHSNPFTMTTSPSSASSPNIVGSFMTAGFSVYPVPEPSVFALWGMSSLALAISRRRGV